MARFSIIIPSFNAAAYIAATLQSVLNQGRTDIEVLVVDGGSSDGTVDVVRNIASLTVKIVSEPDKGQLDAVQKGLRLASGEICHWLNADDIMMPGTLNYVDRVFSDQTVDFVYADDFAFDESLALLAVGPTIKGLTHEDHYLFYRQMYSECVFWRRGVTAFLSEEFYDLRVYTDYAFFLNLTSGRRGRWVPKRLGAFRIRPDQASKINASLASREFELIRKKHRDRIGLNQEDFVRQKRAHWPSFFVRQIAYPWLNRVARRTVRSVSFDYRRKKQSKMFFGFWLGRSIPPSNSLALENIAAVLFR